MQLNWPKIRLSHTQVVWIYIGISALVYRADPIMIAITSALLCAVWLEKHRPARALPTHPWMTHRLATNYCTQFVLLLVFNAVLFATIDWFSTHVGRLSSQISLTHALLSMLVLDCSYYLSLIHI